MSAMAKSITDRNSLRDILPCRLAGEGLEPSRAEPEDNDAADARSRFVNGLEPLRAEGEGNAADDAMRRFMGWFMLRLLDSESLLGWNTMLLGSFGWKSGGGSVVAEWDNFIKEKKTFVAVELGVTEKRILRSSYSLLVNS
jgi:hypothetical protein